jgi:hypothetical protein
MQSGAWRYVNQFLQSVSGRKCMDAPGYKGKWRRTNGHDLHLEVMQMAPGQPNIAYMTVS